MANINSDKDFDRKNNIYKGNIDEYELVDFSDMYEQYIRTYIKENNIDPQENESFEDDVADMYLEWLDTYNDRIKCKPNDYFIPFNGSELVQILIKYIMAHVKLPDPLIEQIVLKKDQTAPLIVKILEYDDNSDKAMDIRITCMNILSEMQYPLPLMQYISFIEKGDNEDAVAQNAYEIIDEQISEEDYYAILDAYDKTQNEYAKNTYLDLMARFSGNEEAYKRLISAFSENINNDNIAFYAACLAKFGDDRAVKILKDALKNNDYDYLNFTAIKYAAEQLGEDINIERTFDGDATYELLKNDPED